MFGVFSEIISHNKNISPFQICFIYHCWHVKLMTWNKMLPVFTNAEAKQYAISLHFLHRVCELLPMSTEHLTHRQLKMNYGYWWLGAEAPGLQYPECWLNNQCIDSIAPISCYILTHLPLDKMAHISQTIFSEAIQWMKSLTFCLKFHQSLLPKVQLTITQHWLR